MRYAFLARQADPDLAGRVPAPEDFGTLRVLHVGHHAVAVLYIGAFHGDKHDIGLIPFDHEVRRVRQQRIVIFRVDVRGGGTGLSHREADQMPIEFDALRGQRVDWRFFWFEQERGVGREVDRLGDADVFEKAIPEPVAHGDDLSCRGIERLGDGPPGR
jgi:hypothetical protein